MVHKDRKQSIKQVEDIDSLAHCLTQATLEGCKGFEYKGYIFLNCSADSIEAQKYAIFKKGYLIQVDSITFGWCTINQARKYIENIISENYDIQNLDNNYNGMLSVTRLKETLHIL